MCKSRAYKHSCGHTSVKRLSSCRFTYASPTSNTPLCSADHAPSFIVTIDKACQSCQYTVFLRNWQKRIDEVRDQYHLARSLTHELSMSNDWECSECSDAWESSDSSCSDDFGFNDLEKATQEQTRLGQELERLTKQFEREQWAKFQGMMAAPKLDATQARMAKDRRRRPSPRHCGRSSLHLSISADDLPDLVDCAAEDDSSSAASVASDESSDYADSDSSITPSTESWPTSWEWGFDEDGETAFSSTWKSKHANEPLGTIDDVDADDESQGMLPCW